jgi:hypothetical protein
MTSSEVSYLISPSRAAIPPAHDLRFSACFLKELSPFSAVLSDCRHGTRRSGRPNGTKLMSGTYLKHSSNLRPTRMDWCVIYDRNSLAMPGTCLDLQSEMENPGVQVKIRRIITSFG